MKRTKSSVKNGVRYLDTNRLSKIQDINSPIKAKANILHLLVIAILTFVAFFPSLKADITNWDDGAYIENNPYNKNLSVENIKAIFAETSYMGNYHPLTLLSLAIDAQFAGKTKDLKPEPVVFHIVNLLIHIAVSILTYFIALKILRNSKAALLVGILFGIHTLHVESVAWLSERKDVLYSFFFMMSILSYLAYLQKKHWGYLISSFLLFSLSLLSKGQAVSLTVTIILLDIFYKRNLKDFKLWLEKLPFFIMSLVFGIIAIKAQKEGEALVMGQGYDFLQRISIASYGFTMYVLKLFLPIRLSAIYPYPDLTSTSLPWYYILSILFPLTIIFVFIKMLKKQPVIALGIAFFAVNIALLLQLIPVGSAVYADRYSYIPSLGFFLILAWLFAQLFNKFSKYKHIFLIIISAYILGLIALSFERCKVWENSLALWNDTIEKSPYSVVALNNRGSLKNIEARELAEKNQIDEAIPIFKEAINDFDVAVKKKPDYSHAFYNRGISKYELGKNIGDSTMFYEALSDLNEALKYDEEFHEAYSYRANVFSELNQFDFALSDYNLALELKPNNVDYIINRGINFGKMGQLNKAVKDLEFAIELDSLNPSAYVNLGRAYAGLKEYEKSINLYTKALELKPELDVAKFNRAISYWFLKNNEKALKELNELIEQSPNFSDAYLKRGQIYLDLKDKTAACNDLNMAKQLGNRDAEAYIKYYCL